MPSESDRPEEFKAPEGRPAAVRARARSGVGLPPNREQRRLVWNVLCDYYDDPAETDMLVAISDGFASYSAQLVCMGKEVGASLEMADLHAIAKDCRYLAELVPGVLGDLNTWPATLCARLRERLDRFPSNADALLLADGVDVWPTLQHLRSIVLRPGHWHEFASVPSDLRRLADACEACPPLPTRTKPTNGPRRRFEKGIRDALRRWPPLADSKITRDAFILDIFSALGVKAPRRL